MRLQGGQQSVVLGQLVVERGGQGVARQTDLTVAGRSITEGLKEEVSWSIIKQLFLS